jgi:hypothetical protein
MQRTVTSRTHRAGGGQDDHRRDDAREQDGQLISIILTDAHGLVLSQPTADHDPDRYLESMMLRRSGSWPRWTAHASNCSRTSDRARATTYSPSG